MPASESLGWFWRPFEDEVALRLHLEPVDGQRADKAVWETKGGHQVHFWFVRGALVSVRIPRASQFVPHEAVARSDDLSPTWDGDSVTLPLMSEFLVARRALVSSEIHGLQAEVMVDPRARIVGLNIVNAKRILLPSVAQALRAMGLHGNDDAQTPRQ